MRFKNLLLALVTAMSLAGCYVYDGYGYDHGGRDWHHHYEHDYDGGHGPRHG